MTTIDFIVNFKGKTIPLTKWTTDSTIDQVKTWLAEETGIIKDCQKLLWKGKVLQDDAATLAMVGITAQSKVILMGSQQAQVAAVQRLDNDIAQRRRRQPISRVKPSSTPRSIRDINYTFHRITVLPEFKEQEKARQLLERLRDDRGIQAIMTQRRWSVGELTELTPFETSILGYNRNAGQLIAIRLRTDDLSGFRHYDSIRKVLLHELTHNVWGDHDDNFHKLNRQLNKDVVALDWTSHGGHQLSNDEYFQPEEDQVDGLVTWQAGSYRLGGKSSSGIESAALRREQIANAALSRLTKQEEQEMDEGCGS
ncbi:WLM domain-containing protein [Halteromyces radiatus]|uniref:WLM domain-containing protein n=1 Tax=Halteromyces radiatus TaxID=101107 RepID=UPI002220E872|nr:WLM domain-containing protein [Halteromyces radiatus]KAI8092803.1 WLM domain-containing protein [Halteromyces radiatus]